jgi:chromosome segregation ATPase
LADNVDDLIAAYLRAGERIATLERKLDTAAREADAAGDRKDNGDRKLRDAVARYRKLEQEKETMQASVSQVEEELRIAKKDAQRHKEEAKHTRRRLTTYLRKVEKLEIDQDFALDTITGLKATKQKGQDENLWSDDVLHHMMLIEAAVAGRAWNQRQEVVREREQLAHENGELKAFCEEMLIEVGAIDKQ